MRRAGVLPTSFEAPRRPAMDAASKLPAAYSWIEGTPIYLGENDVHGTCVATAAFNAGAITDMRAGKTTVIDNTAPFALYCELGGMPADMGLDPAVLFRRWQAKPIGGYLLDNIWSIALDDFQTMEQAAIDTGFVFLTARLQQAQMTQTDWATIAGSPEDGGHAFLGTGVIGSRFTDDTWGKECSFEKTWFAQYGMNAWWCVLKAA